MTTGERIKMLRKAAKLSQTELAKLTGYTDRSSIAKIEDNKIELTESKIKLFANVLNVEPSELMGIEKTVIKNDDGLTDQQIELSGIIPTLEDEEISELLSYAKYLKARYKFQGNQE